MGRLNYDQAPALGVPTATPTDVSDQAASTAFVQNLIPPGVVFPYAGPLPPAGWLLCDGSAVSRTTYARLFAAIGTVYGTGDGSTTFNLPELRGEFLRALDNGRGVDTGRTLGTAQSEMEGPHAHPIQGLFNTNQTFTPGSASAVFQNPPNTSSNTSSNAGTENRPRNVAMNFIIKVQ